MKLLALALVSTISWASSSSSSRYVRATDLMPDSRAHTKSDDSDNEPGFWSDHESSDQAPGLGGQQQIQAESPRSLHAAGAEYEQSPPEDTNDWPALQSQQQRTTKQRFGPVGRRRPRSMFFRDSVDPSTVFDPRSDDTKLQEVSSHDFQWQAAAEPHERFYEPPYGVPSSPDPNQWPKLDPTTHIKTNSLARPRPSKSEQEIDWQPPYTESDETANMHDFHASESVQQAPWNFEGGKQTDSPDQSQWPILGQATHTKPNSLAGPRPSKSEQEINWQPPCTEADATANMHDYVHPWNSECGRPKVSPVRFDDPKPRRLPGAGQRRPHKSEMRPVQLQPTQWGRRGYDLDVGTPSSSASSASPVQSKPEYPELSNIRPPRGLARQIKHIDRRTQEAQQTAPQTQYGDQTRQM